MWPIYILVLIASLTGAYQLQESRSVPVVAATAAAPEQAQNLVSYYNFLAQFVSTQTSGYTAPATGNVVPDSSITFPAWFVRNPLWTNKVIAGHVWVFPTSKPAAGDLTGHVARMSQSVMGVGVTNAASGHLLSPIAGDTGTVYPAGIPNEVVVIHGQLN